MIQLVKEGKPLLSVVLPLEMTNSNDGRGFGWQRSSSMRKKAGKVLKLLGLVRQPFIFPVDLHVTRLWGNKQRRWDSSSIGRGNWKEIEDALVAARWFHNDSPKWIRRTYFDQRKSDDGKCHIEVEVWPTREGQQQ